MSYIKPDQLIDSIIHSGVVKTNLTATQMWVRGALSGAILGAATTLALTAYRPEEKDKAQGALNFCVFAVLAVSSLASGVLVTTRGWALLNVGSLLPLGMTAAALMWLALHQRRQQNT